MRWPRSVSQALPLEELEEAVDRAWVLVDRPVHIPEFAEASRHGGQRKVRRIAITDFVPGQRSRHAGVGCWAHRVGSSYCPILRILVVVDEYTVPLLLPP